MDINLMGILGPVLDNLFIGVTIYDHEGRHIYFNQYAAKIGDLTPGDTLGYLIKEVSNVREEESPTMTALKTGKPVQGIYMQYRTARGRLVKSLNHAFPLYFEGKLVGAICFTTDVFALTKMTENKTLAIQEEASAKIDRSAPVPFEQFIGKNPVFREAVDMAKVAAKGPSSVMLVGETGTGKDLFARAIHEYGSRAGKEFIAINCSAIPETLLEGTLFGTTKGAFTGAVDKSGLLEHASGGTIFLDEITSMPLFLQAKLLRVLQDHSVRRVGALNEKKIDLRIISASNISPAQAVSEGILRADFYYRLGVVQIRIPPLRERPEDIPYLVDHFLKTISARFGKKVKGVCPGVLSALQKRDWPGNVRELEHIIESALNFVGHNEYLTESHLKRVSRHIFTIDSKPASQVTEAPSASEVKFSISNSINSIANVARPSSPDLVKGEDDEVEKGKLLMALRASKGKMAKAARALNISPQLMRYKMKKHGLSKTMFETAGEIEDKTVLKT